MDARRDTAPAAAMDWSVDSSDPSAPSFSPGSFTRNACEREFALDRAVPGRELPELALDRDREGGLESDALPTDTTDGVREFARECWRDGAAEE